MSDHRPAADSAAFAWRAPFPRHVFPTAGREGAASVSIPRWRGHAGTASTPPRSGWPGSSLHCARTIIRRARLRDRGLTGSPAASSPSTRAGPERARSDRLRSDSHWGTGWPESARIYPARRTRRRRASIRRNPASRADRRWTREGNPRQRGFPETACHCSPFSSSDPFGYPGGQSGDGIVLSAIPAAFGQAASLLRRWSCDPRSGSLSRNAGPRRKMTDFGAGLPVGLNQVVLGLKVEPELRIAAEPVTEA